MRAAIIALAEELTRARRFVPYSICVECRLVAGVEHKRATGHQPTALTIEERDAVAALHKAADARDVAEWTKFRRT